MNKAAIMAGMAGLIWVSPDLKRRVHCNPLKRYRKIGSERRLWAGALLISGAPCQLFAAYALGSKGFCKLQRQWR